MDYAYPACPYDSDAMPELPPDPAEASEEHPNNSRRRSRGVGEPEARPALRHANPCFPPNRSTANAERLCVTDELTDGSTPNQCRPSRHRRIIRSEAHVVLAFFDLYGTREVAEDTLSPARRTTVGVPRTEARGRNPAGTSRGDRRIVGRSLHRRRPRPRPSRGGIRQLRPDSATRRRRSSEANPRLSSVPTVRPDCVPASIGSKAEETPSDSRRSAGPRTAVAPSPRSRSRRYVTSTTPSSARRSSCGARSAGDPPTPRKRDSLRSCSAPPNPRIAPRPRCPGLVERPDRAVVRIRGP